MKLKTNIIFTVILAMTVMTNYLYGQAININADGNISNFADEVGIWVNSNSDTYRPDYVDLIEGLDVRSIRHGWAYSVMDPDDPNNFKMSPCDPNVQDYISDGNCNVFESMPVSDIVTLMNEIDVPGFIVLATDGINYTGTADTELAAMTIPEREQFYIDNAVRIATWAKNNNFNYFEIGNENDLPGEMVDLGVGTEWDGEQYGAFAIKMIQAVKEVYPEAKCGINGGWRSTEALRTAWWDGILVGAPNINDWIDFVVIHKYEFFADYDIWSQNVWEFGRINSDNASTTAANFPGTPIYITEIAGFKGEDLDGNGTNNEIGAYRGVLNVEMMGNVFLDQSVELTQHWGTRWQDLGAFDRNTDTYNMMGNAQRAYTDFMKPRLVSNGVDGTVRYFASKDPADNSTTVWLCNHSDQMVTKDIAIQNFAGSTDNELWRLTSPNNDPLAETNSLWQDGSVQVISSGQGSTINFTATVSPTSVTVITFAAGSGSGETPGEGAITRYEAENGTLSGGAVVDDIHSGFSGTGFVSGTLLKEGAQTLLNVDVPTAGDYNVTVRYAAGNADATGNGLYVNGSLITTFTCVSTGAWTTWGNSVQTVNLNAGSNTIAVRQETRTVDVINFDYIDIQATSGGGGNPANQAPTVSLTAPADNASFTVGDNVVISANASDSDGSVTKVEFYQDGNLLGEDTSSPYSYTWNSPAEGSYSLTARATDDDGAVRVSSARSITVNAAAPTTYSLTVNSGSGGGNYEAGTVVNISANAAPSGQQFDKWTGNTGIIADVNAASTTVTMPTGNRTVNATYVDIPVSGTDNVALNKTATQSSDFQNFTADLAVDGNTNGQFSGGSVTHTACGSNDWWRVDLGSNYDVGDINVYNRTDCCSGRLDDYNVKVLNGSLNEVWSNFQSSPAGSPTTVNAGGTTGRYVEIQKTTSGCLSLAEVEVFASSGGGTPPANQSPSVSITSPGNNASFTAGDNISITASASDSDGSVSKVEFYQGGTKLGEDTSSPYSFNWNNVSAGSYSLTAVATDNDGATTTSAAVSVTVNAASSGNGYRYLRITGESKVQNPIRVQRLRWLVGSMEYPNPLLTNGSTVTADPNIAGAWRAFNGNNQPWDVMSNLPASLTIDLGAGGEIEPTGVKLDVNGSNRGFASFSCYGSNDGSNFTLIKSFSGLTSADYPGTIGLFSFDGAARAVQAESEIAEITEVSTYPNPVHDFLQTKGVDGIFSIQIYSLRGERVFQQQNLSNGNQINVSDLNKGVYFVNILDQSGNTSIVRILKD